MIRIAYLWVVLGVFVGQVSGFDLIPFREDVWGYADPFGSIVYVPEYKFAGVFRNGIARVQTKEEYGYIAMNGRTFFASNLESARDFSDGMAAVKIKGTGKWGFINSMFSMAVPPAYQEVGDFSENVAPVQLNGKWGVIDKQGKVLVPFKKPCRENAMAVCTKRQAQQDGSTRKGSRLGFFCGSILVHDLGRGPFCSRPVCVWYAGPGLHGVMPAFCGAV